MVLLPFRELPLPLPLVVASASLLLPPLSAASFDGAALSLDGAPKRRSASCLAVAAPTSEAHAIPLEQRASAASESNRLHAEKTTTFSDAAAAWRTTWTSAAILVPYSRTSLPSRLSSRAPSEESAAAESGEQAAAAGVDADADEFRACEPSVVGLPGNGSDSARRGSGPGGGDDDDGNSGAGGGGGATSNSRGTVPPALQTGHVCRSLYPRDDALIASGMATRRHHPRGGITIVRVANRARLCFQSHHVCCPRRLAGLTMVGCIAAARRACTIATAAFPLSCDCAASASAARACLRRFCPIEPVELCAQEALIGRLLLK